MIAPLRTALRLVLWPVIRAVVWAQAQFEIAHNEALLKRLDADDRRTVGLYGRIRIVKPEGCKVGAHVSIHDADWNATGGITIGRYVHFGPRVAILTVSHNIDGRAIPYDNTVVAKPVVIEDFCWIGQDVVIAPGSYVEEGFASRYAPVVSGRIPRGSIIWSAEIPPAQNSRHGPIRR